MALIYRWSKGAVQPNDFYDLSDPDPLNGLPLFENGGGRPDAPPGEEGNITKQRIEGT